MEHKFIAFAIIIFFLVSVSIYAFVNRIYKNKIESQSHTIKSLKHTINGLDIMLRQKENEIKQLHLLIHRERCQSLPRSKYRIIPFDYHGSQLWILI